MRSKTVGLRTRLVCRPKKLVLVLYIVVLVLILVLQVWCCVLKHGLVTLVVIMILKDTETFQKYYIQFLYILCLDHHYCGDQLTVAFTYLKVKSAKCLCLLPVVLVLVLVAPCGLRGCKN